MGYDNEYVPPVESAVNTLWQETLAAVPTLSSIPVFWDFGESDHFHSSRGFAVTRTDGYSFWLILSEKLKEQSQDRIEAIICHEIGHIVDFSGCWVDLEASQNLPLTPERRADAIVELIWKKKILYDENDVQSFASGCSPRPERLGL